MRAARLHQYGPADVLQIDTVPVPQVGPGEVLVAMSASSVNPVDTKLRKGALRVVMRWTLPHTTGLDGVGVVEQIGPQVTELSVGDRVFMAPDPRRAGLCAEKAVVLASECALAPVSATDAQAASLPLVALTAYDCLVRHANVQPGDKVLILGGAGGVGTVAIQMAKALGAVVSTTASPRNTELVTRLGADHVVDYTQHEPADVLSPQDVVLVAVGGAGGTQAMRAARRGARITHIVGDLPRFVASYGPYLGTVMAGLNMAAFWVRCRLRGQRGFNVVKKPDGVALAAVAKWVDSGAIQPVVDQVFPMERVADAHRAVESGKVSGKVVVTHNAPS